jgi:hypothetical protein
VCVCVCVCVCVHVLCVHFCLIFFRCFMSLTCYIQLLQLSFDV